MNKATAPLKPKGTQPPSGVTRLTVCGFKSISREQSIEIRPLTILAGANSSGKSSIMQPLLLLKQTLEAPYDPGPLLLNGPHVKFTSADQLLSRTGREERSDAFSVGIGTSSIGSLTTCFRRHPSTGLEISQVSFDFCKSGKENHLVWRMGMTHDQILAELTKPSQALVLRMGNVEWFIRRDRCFLLPTQRMGPKELPLDVSIALGPEAAIKRDILRLIHVPSLRGNRERTYGVSAVGPTFSGTFENYAASVIEDWQASRQEEKLQGLGKDFEKLGLTWKVVAKKIDDTQVELQVGRLPRATKGAAHDLINIADAGFGLSSMLPVLVALRAAEPDRLLYLEEPEIHLHPNAQYKLAEILTDAVMRGIRVVAETHSALLFLGVQALVAGRRLPAEKVKLHWFSRDANGCTKIRSADLDNAGAFGDWPEDFAAVALKAQKEYLDAAESQMVKG